MTNNGIVTLADLITEAIDLDSFIQYLQTRYEVPEDISRRKIREVVSFEILYEELRLLGYDLPTKNESND